MAVSFRVLLAILLLVVGIVAAVAAFLPVYLTSIDSLRSLGRNLRDEIAERLTVQIKLFFDERMQAVGQVNSMSRMQFLDALVPTTTLAAACDLTVRFKNLFAYFGTERGEFGQCTPTSGTALIQSPMPTGYRANFVVDNITGSFKPTVISNVTSTSTYDPRLRPWYPPLLQSQGWSQVYVNWDGLTSVITVGCPLNSGITTRRGVFAADIATDDLLKFLLGVKIMKTGRAMLLETSSKNSLGGNWNESAIVRDNTTLRLARLSDYHEPLLGRVVAELGEAFIFNASLPASGEFGKGIDSVIWTITAVTDNFGLDMRVLTMIPVRDFLEEVEDNLAVSIATAAASIVVLLIVSLILVFLAFAPLKRVEEQLAHAADFDDHDKNASDDGPSLISEVANIQAAYKKMQSELALVKSFLPQSLLTKLQDEDFDDDETVIDDDLLRGAGRGSSRTPTSSRPGITGRGSTYETESDADDAAKKASHAGTRTSNEQHPHPSPVLIAHTNKQHLQAHQHNADETRSHHSAKSRGAAARAAAGLNTRAGVSMRTITVMVVNLRRFHATAFTNLDAALVSQRVLLEIVKPICDKSGGVIDTFMGDHVTVSFGAVTLQSGAAPRACIAAREIIEKLTKSHILMQQGYSGCSIGVASADARVGNMGTTELRKFNMITPALAQAWHLERFCKIQDPSIELLVSATTARLSGIELHMEPIDYVRLPGEDLASIAYTVLAPKGCTMREGMEWMYQLNKQQEAREADEIITEKNQKTVTIMALYMGTNDTANGTMEQLLSGLGSSMIAPGGNPNFSAPDTPTENSGPSDSLTGNNADFPANRLVIPDNSHPNSVNAAVNSSRDQKSARKQYKKYAPRGLRLVQNHYEKGVVFATYLRQREHEFLEKCLVWQA